jgi:hypothetical protein
MVNASTGEGVTGRLMVGGAVIKGVSLLFQHLAKANAPGEVLNIHLSYMFFVAAVLASQYC